MLRMLLLGLFTLAAVGCGAGNDKPTIPTALKEPPGMDSPGPKAGSPKAKAPDAGGQASSVDK